MTDYLSEIKSLVEAQNAAVEEFRDRHIKRLDKIEKDFNDFAKKANRPGMPASDDDTRRARPQAGEPETWRDVQTKREVKVLWPQHRFSESDAEVKANSVGRFLRGIALGGRADDARELEEERKSMGISHDPSGGFTVDGALASWWVDRLRDQMVLTQAGARTVPMDTASLTIARVTADPTVSWHAENAALSSTKPTLGAVSLNAKTCVCLVKVSLELAQDSANIDAMLQQVLVNAMAGAIDSAGLQGVTTNAGAAPGGVLNLSDRNKVLAVGAPTNYDKFVDAMYELAADNVRLQDIGALVGNPRLWQSLRKLKTGLSGDQTALTAPDEIAKLPKLWTNACPQGSAVIADWRDLLFGVRKQITVKVLSETFLADNLQVAFLAYARVDFQAARQASFCTLEGITY